MMQVNFPRVYLLEECLNTSIVPNVYCYENKDGSKKLVIRKTMKVHGKSQTFSKTVDVPFDCNSRRKLEKFASEQRNEFFKALENSESPELTKMTFSEYFEGPCQSYKSTREKTWNDYNSHYRRHMKDYFCEIKVSEINKVVVANYFKYLDQDYKDLKKILGMDPLEVTILRCGAFDAFARRFGRPIRRMNPNGQDLADLLRSDDYTTGRRDLYGRI